MSEKTNKWFRLFDDIFVQGNNYKKMFGYEGNTGNKKTHILVGGSYKMISIEGYTPQDLIEVGDLVGTDWYNEISSIWRIDEEGLWKDIDDCIMVKDVTKILTPNSNGGYDLQWSADNDKR